MISRRDFLKLGGSALLGATMLGGLGSFAMANPAQTSAAKAPVLFATRDMLEKAKGLVMAKQEPYLSAWTITLERANRGLTANIVPLYSTNHQQYYQRARGHSFFSRDLGIAYAFTGDEQYAFRARDILLAWAMEAKTSFVAINPPRDGLGNIVGSPEGLVIGRTMTVFCYAYSLIYNILSDEDKALIEEWMAFMATRIKVSQAHWINSSYFGNQYYNNHLGAHTMGMAAIGFVTGDQNLVRYAIDSPENPRNAKELINGAILMPGDLPWEEEYDPSPVTQAGEIYDRYRTVQGTGLHYTILHLRLLTQIAEMAHNNKDVDLYKYTGPNGENLERSFEFYSEFYITKDPSSRGGYYTSDIARPREEFVRLEDVNIFEIAHKRYMGNKQIKRVLETCERVVDEIETLGATAVLTHGMNDIKPE